MRTLTFLLFLLALAPVAGQQMAAEDAVLRQRVADGDLTHEQYAKLAADIRDAADEQGGYPVMPVDSLGRYRLTRMLSTDGNFSTVCGATERWLALGGFTGAERYTRTTNSSFVRYVVTPYRFAGQHRQLLAGMSGGPYPLTIACVLELRETEEGVQLILSDPLMTEQVLESYDPGLDFARQYVLREHWYQIADFLPLVAGKPDEYADRLRHAKLMDECLNGLADSLVAFLE